ncbi:MAG: ABC transporter ATP-binding protein [Deltaproteobacteria bacterium]|nr:ABC transporter ATP-binding protein [Deltaproteobacteria bacterium]
MPLLQTHGLSKSYQEGEKALHVFADIDFTLEAGEIVGISGPSGSGKSTLLHLMGGLDRPSSGTVKIDGKSIHDMSDREQAIFRNQTLGFVFQFYHLLPELTALENAMLPCLIAGDSQAQARQKGSDVLAQVGLRERLAHYPSELSGGEQQRVAIARAMAMRPKLLLADEPTGNLDQETSAKVWDLLLHVQREYGMAMVIVSHNPELLSTLPKQFELRGGSLHSLL